jgi:hypothetical protein
MRIAQLASAENSALVNGTHFALSLADTAVGEDVLALYFVALLLPPD